MRTLMSWSNSEVRIDGRPLPAGRGVELCAEEPDVLVMSPSSAYVTGIAQNRRFVAYYTAFYRGAYRRAGRIEGHTVDAEKAGARVHFDTRTGEGTYSVTA